VTSGLTEQMTIPAAPLPIRYFWVLPYLRPFWVVVIFS
jgi:hypothetical protein